MPVLFCETHYLVFYGRAVSRADSFYSSGEERRAVDVFPDDLVCVLIGICEPAGYLISCEILGGVFKRERYYLLVAELFLHFGKVNASLINSRRCTCFKTSHLYTEVYQGLCKIICSRKSVGSGVLAYLAVYASGFKVYAGTDDSCLAGVDVIGGSFYTGNFNYVSGF